MKTERWSPADRCVAGVEVGGALEEDVVVDGRPLREGPSLGRDLFAVVHEVDLGQAQLFAGGARQLGAAGGDRRCRCHRRRH
ncbi:hypothetical protein ADL29_34610 [Streptomyces chattanoogensis]|uniref:Uncharacterized protein n=1 Tax=Streptomyces chattanoogensis TaxID=66876 RepID=A0A0N1JW53_9ACTN|nr:hypothetical protein ADL29_34610 [Streptomyces chattanoogensis]